MPTGDTNVNGFLAGRNIGEAQPRDAVDPQRVYCSVYEFATHTLRQPLVLDSELLDYYCLENEKSWVHMK